MSFDFLIIGQGICGTWLSYYLQKAGYSFLIIDEPQKSSASKVAAGIVNPVTGRRIVKTWMIDEVMPFIANAYREFGNEFGIEAISQKNIVDFFPSAQMRLAFLDRYAEDQSYLSLSNDEQKWGEYFNYELGFGMIQPTWLVNLQEMLPVYRKHLSANNFLLEDKFELQQLQLKSDHIQYKDLKASHIIFCDGIASASNSFFTKLPFAPNKGEVLWIEMADFPKENIFKNGINLVPWKDDIYWVGSSYEWEFDHDQPTDIFRERITAILKKWIKPSFKVLDHQASVRPATLERRPFVGFHPVHENIGIFNGMGTKGCSLAPWLANDFVNHLRYKSKIQPEADIKRFTRILSKQ